jgi:hypothetical protein
MGEHVWIVREGRRIAGFTRCGAVDLLRLFSHVSSIGETQMKTVVTVFWMIVMFTATANAQTMIIGSDNRETAFGTDPVIHINSLFRTAVTLKEGQMIPEGTTLEAARRELYQMSENECQTLAQIYKAECRLSSVTINGVLPAPNQQPQTTVTANASYELRPRGGR